jgi:hypothetical protein
MTASVTYLSERVDWRGRRRVPGRATNEVIASLPCKIYWAADCFAHRSGRMLTVVPAWPDPCGNEVRPEPS